MVQNPKGQIGKMVARTPFVDPRNMVLRKNVEFDSLLNKASGPRAILAKKDSSQPSSLLEAYSGPLQSIPMVSDRSDF